MIPKTRKHRPAKMRKGRFSVPSLRLTKDNINKIPRPNFGEIFYWDTKYKGFGLRVRPSGMVYIVQARPNRRRGTKLIRVKIGKHGILTPDVAETQARIILGEIAKGIDPNAREVEEAARSVTLRQVYDEYMKVRTLRPKTRKVYESTMRRCFHDWMDRRILDITKDMVQKRHRAISTANGPRGKGEAQANQAMRLLSSLLNYASAAYEDNSGRSILPENPVRRLTQTRSWNKNRRRRDVIFPEQLDAWYAAVQKVENDTMRDYILLCLFTGLRRSEAAQLTWKHINFETRVMVIPEENTKSDREHALPLSDFVYELLKKRHQTMVRYLGNDYVFPARVGVGYMTEPRKAIQNVIRDSGVKFSMHTLRRTFVTIAEQLDIPHYALKSLLNHSLESDVTAGYIVIKVDRLRGPMQRITDFIVQRIRPAANRGPLMNDML